LFLAFALFFSSFSLAQFKPYTSNPNEQVTAASPVKRVYLKVNPFTVLAGPIINTSEYRLGVEMVGGNRFSYELHGSYLSKWVLLYADFWNDTIQNLVRQINFPGFRIQGAVRYYFIKLATDKDLSSYYQPSGMYLSLHGSYAAANLRIIGQPLPTQDWSNLQLMMRLGIQILNEDRAGLDLFTGIGYKENRAFNTDTRGRTTALNLQEVIGDGLGDYIASPFKFALGFSFTFGLF
jgi:hypothetical protein